MGKIYIGIDIGGSWLKGVALKLSDGMMLADIPILLKQQPVLRVKSRLGVGSATSEFIEALKELLAVLLLADQKVGGIGISTAGVVDYSGSKMLVAVSHLKALTDNSWIAYLETRFNVPVTLINDADAASIGAAVSGYLSGFNTIGVMPIGTGLGFTCWRNGRKWTPNFAIPLLGCTYTPTGYYDEIASVSALAALDPDRNLSTIFVQDKFEENRKKYIRNLAGIISTSALLYGTNKILIGGGLAEAVTAVGFPLADSLKLALSQANLLSTADVEIGVMPEGNLLPLLGVVLLAIGEEKAQACHVKKPYNQLNTEIPFDETIRLEQLPTVELVSLLWESEQSSGENLKKSLVSITGVADQITQRLKEGGRLIYVGSGTSGRLAAIDTVEIACTFGFPRERVLTFISGGVADASYDIETNFEEDASSVPEMLLANINAKDIVIGISVSGSAYYVQSALGFAKFTGAYTVLIQEQAAEELPFCDRVISLQSGNEVLAGSTRMKAGTATKKVLNFLSTTAMIRLGKVHGCYMTEVECINEKLIKRAQYILLTLYGLDENEAYEALKENDFVLSRIIEKLNKGAEDIR